MTHNPKGLDVRTEVLGGMCLGPLGSPWITEGASADVTTVACRQVTTVALRCLIKGLLHIIFLPLLSLRRLFFVEIGKTVAPCNWPQNGVLTASSPMYNLDGLRGWTRRV